MIYLKGQCTLLADADIKVSETSGNASALIRLVTNNKGMTGNYDQPCYLFGRVVGEAAEDGLRLKKGDFITLTNAKLEMYKRKNADGDEIEIDGYPYFAYSATIFDFTLDSTKEERVEEKASNKRRRRGTNKIEEGLEKVGEEADDDLPF